MASTDEICAHVTNAIVLPYQPQFVSSTLNVSLGSALAQEL